MFNLTYEERKVILFLCGVAFLGMGLNFLIKIKPASSTVLKVSPDSELAKLEINSVSYADLLKFKCISPGLAKKIIDYRALYGPFENLEDLKKIKGIKDYRYEKLKKLFYISR